MPRIDAIDCSHWNSVKSFPDIAKSGVIGVIQKCTEGTSYYDDTYGSRMPQALSAGLSWGAYHFLKHGNIQKQMAWFFQMAALPAGSRWAIDYEDPACTLDDLKQSLEELELLDPTAQIAVYTGYLVKQQVSSTGKYPWLAKHPLWLAHYTSGTPVWPVNIWPHWSLWQYTDKGTVPGMSGAVDLNEFNGTPEQCAKWFGPIVQPVPVPTPAPSHPVVEVALAIPDGVDVSIMINGAQVYGTPPADHHGMRAGEE